MGEAVNTTIIWRPPVDARDLPLLKQLTMESECIVSWIPEFREGKWDEFIGEQIQYGTEYFAHLDANFLSRLMEFKTDHDKSLLHRQTAAVMCLAICADMKVNPTFATHEYAFSGSYEPDERLSYFYVLNNTHPQVYSDLAHGRITHIPDSGKLKRTPHFGTHKNRTRWFGLVYLPLLKMMEIHVNPEYASTDKGQSGTNKIKALIRWMFDDFLLVGAVVLAAHELWGTRPRKSIVSCPNSTDPTKVLRSIENAAWDLTLALNWIEWEGSRNFDEKKDPIHFVFTHDKSLARIALASIGEAGLEDVDKKYMLELKELWPSAIASELFQFHRHFELRKDVRARKYLSAIDKTEYFEKQKEKIIQSIRKNCC